MNCEVSRSASTRVVFPAPDGAEITKRIPWRLNWLLKILDLLANSFQLGLGGDDALGNGGVIGFGTERVQFAKNFLGDELKSTADRFVPAQVVGELREVAFHSRQFFGDIGAVGEKRNLFQQPIIIHF